MMYDHEKSDPAIVAVKPTNKAGQPAAELMARALAECRTTAPGAKLPFVRKQPPPTCST